MSAAANNGSDKQKRPITIIGLEGSANKIGIGIVRDGQVNDALIRTSTITSKIS